MNLYNSYYIVVEVINLVWLIVNFLADDDDITPYATFTLKPISGMDTTRSLMSVPSGRGADSYSSNSIEGEFVVVCYLFD